MEKQHVNAIPSLKKSVFHIKFNLQRNHTPNYRIPFVKKHK